MSGMPLSFPRLLALLILAPPLSSCSLITWDCGTPTTRESLAEGVSRSNVDTLGLDGVASIYEERGGDRGYIHQAVVTLEAPNAVHYDTVPDFLRAHVTGASLELASGQILLRVAMTNNSSFANGPPVLAAIAVNDMEQSQFNSLRAHLLANELWIAIESDSAVRFPRTQLRVTSSHDWQKNPCP